MAVAATERVEPTRLTAGERRLAWWLRFFALLFAVGAVGFLLRPDETVTDLDRLGAWLGLPVLPASRVAVASDFWLALAVANMVTITACCWLAAADVRQRRVLVYPVVASKIASSAIGLLLFARWAHTLSLLSITLVDLPIALILIRALRRARTPA